MNFLFKRLKKLLGFYALRGYFRWLFYNLVEMRPIADHRTWNRLLAVDRTGKSVLIVEPNDYHAVVLPGLAAYFDGLSYNVTILSRPANIESSAFARVPSAKRPLFCALPPSLMAKYLKKHSNDYDVVVMASSVWEAVAPGRSTPYIDYLGIRPIAERNFLLMEHDLRDVNTHGDENFSQRNRLLALTAFPNAPKALAVLPLNFGNVTITPKNHEITRFIIVGRMTSYCRNVNLLLDAVRKLHENNVRNFEIILVGEGRLDIQPPELRQYFVLRGPLRYAEMYGEMERADFFLALLDPADDKHLPYRTHKTTGSRLLVLGFCKPFVVNELFAAPYEFDESNAVIYSGNELAEAMERAVKMDENTYKQMQDELARQAETVRRQSMDNLRLAIDSIES